MIKPYLMTGAAILALACFSPVASAQSERGGGQGATKSEQGAGGGAAERGGSKAGSQSSMGGSESKGAASQSQKSAQGSERSSSGGHKSSANGQAAGETGKGQAAGEPGKGKSAEAGDQRGSDRGDKAGKSRADKSDSDKMKSKSAEERGGKDKDHSKSAEKNRDNDKSKRADRDHDGKTGKTAGDEKGMDRDKNRQVQDRDRNERNKQAGNERAGQKQGRVSFTEDQRSRFRDTIKKQNVRNEKVNVNVSIGVRLPRDRVRLHALPAAFISIAPDYRRYRYALIDDRYCIVDPDTYEIVYIIDEGGGGLHRSGGGQVATLDLSANERQIVLRHVDWDRRADLNIDLALGADIPGRVTLIDFPPPVIDEVPKLRGYRYVVLEKRVAIVDPQDREVLLVIRD